MAAIGGAVGLGNITPTSVAASGTVTGSNLSGTNTGDQTITLTGDVTGISLTHVILNQHDYFIEVMYSHEPGLV